MATSMTRGVWTRSTIILRTDSVRTIDLPVFLCPALIISGVPKKNFHSRSTIHNASASPKSARLLHSTSNVLPEGIYHGPNAVSTRLPGQCAGCGAFSQTLNDGEPGFYSLNRRSVREYLAPTAKPETTKRISERAAIEASLRNLEKDVSRTLSIGFPALKVQQTETLLCDRCHKLRHHHSGVSIQHPSIESIQDTIFESPHKYNHVYHVIDAADFPMSLVPRLHELLHLNPQRSLNRRSKNDKFYHGKKNEISFIITRSDLLAPLKAQVDSLMPYLVNTLRDALRHTGKDVRLGNVRCVSSKRGWWTRELKEDIWNRGGGGWMVGKVNVGKSQLFESVFPKGRRKLTKVDRPFPTSALKGHFSIASENEALENATVSEDLESSKKGSNELLRNELEKTNSLLPPLRPEADYPPMPLVSPLPGTTASPIRLPFGDGKGELVDLPGLSRGDLESYVQEPHRQSLVMRSRVRPKQQVIKPGQSLLLGGFIRITPLRQDTIILAYVFTPMSSHLTSTEKAIQIQKQQREFGTENIAVAGVGERIKSAGTFSLKWDVTKQRSGPITVNHAIGIKVDKLPYQVVSTDILIEGCGWVELVAQVRRKALQSDFHLRKESHRELLGFSLGDSEWPQVEVFSPEGGFIGARRPLGAWALSGQIKSTAQMKGRPRRSMKGAKKRLKALESII